MQEGVGQAVGDGQAEGDLDEQDGAVWQAVQDDSPCLMVRLLRIHSLNFIVGKAEPATFILCAKPEITVAVYFKHPHHRTFALQEALYLFFG